MQFLMCEPIFFDIKYEINPWMNRCVSVDRKKAHQQWFALAQAIESCGASIAYIEQAPECPDMVFTANYGFVFDHSVYLSFFKYPERQDERKYIKPWFEQQGFTLYGDAFLRNAKIDDPIAYQSLYFEGNGDVAVTNKHLFIAHGFRTDYHIYPAIKACVPHLSCVELKLVDSRFYHLDTCFCPLNDALALRYPGAFDEMSNYAIDRNIECIDVSDFEAECFVCNSVVIGKQVIMPSGCDVVASELQSRGFNVICCNFSEFMKAGGAGRCLTLQIA